MKPPARVVIFTDLDGTLLDHHSYSWRAAQPALEAIRRRRVPLIFCSSKTRAEVEVLRKELRNRHPFITENGGGIFIPRNYFPRAIPGAKRTGRYSCLALARGYEEMVGQLREISRQAGAEVIGFHQMTLARVAARTGLRLRQAELARQREFDEPFLFVGSRAGAEAKFRRLARRRGLELARGGRFWHLFAGSDKGRAVRRLIRSYQGGAAPRLRTVALGDSANDLPMLAAVHRAILLPKPDGSFDGRVLARLPKVTRGRAPGPQGWNLAVLALLKD